MQNFLRSLLYLISCLFFSFANAQLNSISTGNVNSPVCRGSSISIPFTINGNFGSGNVFTAQLSDVNGSFSNAIAIGTINSTSSGTILATIPSGTTAGIKYRVRVNGSNPSVIGSDNGSDVIINALPLTPSAIQTVGGAAKVCPGDIKTYYVPWSADVLSYSWSALSAGGTIMNQRSSASADSVDVIYDSGLSSSFILIVKAVNACGISSLRSLSIGKNSQPTPTAIIGPVTEVCAGTTGVQYSVTNSPGVSYSWIFTTGVDAIINQSGSNSVTVDFGPGWTSGTLGVTADNGSSCGLSSLRTLAIGSVPNVPSVISLVGSKVKVCPGDIVTYYVPKPAGVSYFNWSATGTGYTLLNQRSSSTADSIDVYYDTNLSGYVTLNVTASNSCGTSGVRTLNVFKNTPLTPGPISGPATEICAGSSGVTYSVPLTIGYTYEWSFTTVVDAVINQLGTNSITIDFGLNWTTGKLSVVASNGTSCGLSSITKLTIESKPGAIQKVGKQSKVCPGDMGTYYVAKTPDALSYNWSVTGAGVTLSNQRSSAMADSIDLNFDSNFSSFATVSVVANRPCGISPMSSLAIYVNNPAPPGFIVGAVNEVCAGASNMVYSVPYVAGLKYFWYFPSSVDAVINQDSSNYVTIDFGPNWTTEKLYVIAYNGSTCGGSAPRSTTIWSKPPTPGNIAVLGTNTKVCPGDIKTYYIQKVFNTNSYTWSTSSPGGSLYNQRSSAFADSIDIIFDQDLGGSFVLNVTGENLCGTGPVRSLTIFSNVPLLPDPISGQSTEVCANSTFQYSVSSVAGLTYEWYFMSPQDAVIHQNGSNAATIDYGPTWVSGVLAVKAINGTCPASRARSLVLSSKAAVPGAIYTLGGAARVCPGDVKTYYIAKVANASSYSWSMPSAGCTLANHRTSATADSIDVIFDSAIGLTSVLSVTADNLCGSSNPRTLTISKKALYYPDLDGDGYGFGTPANGCGAPAGYVDNNYDCNDANNKIHPGAVEFCNGIDDNCNAKIDEGVKQVFYLDADADGYGDLFVSSDSLCISPLGYVSDSTDCDDADSFINPGKSEVCNGIDDNCDNQIDEGVTTTYFEDADGDGYGDQHLIMNACSIPFGFVENSYDCDDSNDRVFPGVAEVCNGYDDDCNNQVDEGVKIIYFQDLDLDGYGNPAVASQPLCAPPAGYVSDNGDCDDTNEAIFPDASEVCNGLDDNCNGDIDEGVLIPFYRDSDADGFGDVNIVVSACLAPAGYVQDNTDCNDSQILYADIDGDGFGAGLPTGCGLLDNTDCNDLANNVHPGMTEACNFVDDDCDGEIDEGVQNTYYRDLDGDGFGDPSVWVMDCALPAGYVVDNTDCDDSRMLYIDKDGDGFGAGIPVACGLPLNTDCEDSLSAVNPGAREICNLIDDNCNGQVDEGVAVTYYLDSDGDSYGNHLISIRACSPPAGYVLDNNDCDDNNITYRDDDGDGFGGNAFSACGSLLNTDCDDSKSNVYPGATEICNSIDDNCNGQVDEGVLATYYRDADGDGYGNADLVAQGCSVPGGFTLNSTDCNDNSATVNPGAPEICINGIDDNCNSLIDEGCCPVCTKAPATPSTITSSGGSLSVCPDNTRIYSVKAVSCVSYNWIPPIGGVIISGQGTSTVRITYNSNFLLTGKGTISVKAYNSCGESAARTLTVTKKSNPSQPGSISVTGGTANVCPGDARIYSVSSVSEIIYHWAPPTGGIITNGQNTNSIRMAFDNSFIANDTVFVVADNGCGLSAPRMRIIYRNLPPMPGGISYSGGTAAVCPGDVRNYSVKPVSGLTYFWTTPVGAIITSGQGTNSISVLYNQDFSAPSGIISVASVNNCASSAPRSITIYRSQPAKQPGYIAVSGGTAAVCPGDVRTYQVTAVANTIYTWIPPIGGNILSGQGTNSINLSFDNGFIDKDTLFVSASNSCGSSIPRSLVITRNLPGTPSSITVTGGTAAVCPGDLRTYTVSLATGVTYLWTTPVGSRIVAGQGTNSVSVFYEDTFSTSGSLSVIASNSCGSSSPRSTNVVLNNPSLPGPISGPTSVCKNSTNTYFISPVVNASSYVWAVPADATIQGAATGDSVIVVFGASGGIISVKSVNACGISSARSLSVKITCREAEIESALQVGNLNAHLYPNPAQGQTALEFSSIDRMAYQVHLLDLTGRSILAKEGVAEKGLNLLQLDLSNYAKGLYMLEVKVGDDMVQMKVVLE